MQKKLLLLSFVEGAAVMAAELCGAKLLAPVFGSSLFVWASVMGVTLAALALGYFSGGWISQGSTKHQLTLYRILNAAALFLLLMPVISFYLVPRISYLPFLPGVVLSTLVLLVFPIFFLGATSPLFILLQTTRETQAGKVSGTVYAVSTAGGIVATFLCGFFLIPELGLNACLAGFGAILFLSNLAVFKIFKPAHFFLFAAFAYLNFQFTLKKTGSLSYSDGMLGRMEVKDLLNTQNKPYRVLTVNDIVQTEMLLETGRSLSEYIVVMDTLIPQSTHADHALVLGLGGGLVANLLQGKKYKTEGVELDERIVEAAKNYFFLDPEVETYSGDARYFLNKCQKKYAIVIVDIFKGEEQPSHILTKESLQKLRANLSSSALLLVNWHGYTSGVKGLGTSILYNTLMQAGFKVKLCSTSGDENYRNLVFVASLSDTGALPYELHDEMVRTTLVNTDNRPLLEKYNAEANKAWRLNYLRYYQQKTN